MVLIDKFQLFSRRRLASNPLSLDHAAILLSQLSVAVAQVVIPLTLVDGSVCVLFKPVTGTLVIVELAFVATAIRPRYRPVAMLHVILPIPFIPFAIRMCQYSKAIFLPILKVAVINSSILVEESLPISFVSLKAARVIAIIGKDEDPFTFKFISLELPFILLAVGQVSLVADALLPVLVELALVDVFFGDEAALALALVVLEVAFVEEAIADDGAPPFDVLTFPLAQIDRPIIHLELIRSEFTVAAFRGRFIILKFWQVFPNGIYRGRNINDQRARKSWKRAVIGNKALLLGTQVRQLLLRLIHVQVAFFYRFVAILDHFKQLFFLGL